MNPLPTWTVEFLKPDAVTLQAVSSTEAVRHVRRVYGPLAVVRSVEPASAPQPETPKP